MPVAIAVTKKDGLSDCKVILFRRADLVRVQQHSGILLLEHPVGHAGMQLLVQWRAEALIERDQGG
ncbi:MAG: hypothetical protein EBZ13_05780 [Planctomycetia bacterium]|jgi:hypothetical protein|nr:hypothetical protein [Planctomycetia bacterium]